MNVTDRINRILFIMSYVSQNQGVTVEKLAEQKGTNPNAGHVHMCPGGIGRVDGITHRRQQKGPIVDFMRIRRVGGVQLRSDGKAARPQHVLES